MNPTLFSPSFLLSFLQTTTNLCSSEVHLQGCSPILLTFSWVHHLLLFSSFPHFIALHCLLQVKIFKVFLPQSHTYQFVPWFCQKPSQLYHQAYLRISKGIFPWFPLICFQNLLNLWFLLFFGSVPYFSLKYS